MSTQLLYELIGYAASILVAISLTMRSLLRLRWVNLIGSIFFTIYGVLIGAYPVAAVNLFIVFINLYYLRQMRAQKEFFRLLEVSPDSEYLGYLLDQSASEIAQFQPNFRFTPQADQRIFLVTRNLAPAGVVIGRQHDDSLHIALDYALPGYRDLKTGRFVFEHNARALIERGIRRVYSEPGNATHSKYLQALGFQPETSPDGKPVYCLTLPPA